MHFFRKNTCTNWNLFWNLKHCTYIFKNEVVLTLFSNLFSTKKAYAFFVVRGKSARQQSYFFTHYVRKNIFLRFLKVSLWFRHLEFWWFHGSNQIENMAKLIGCKQNLKKCKYIYDISFLNNKWLSECLLMPLIFITNKEDKIDKL